MNHARFTFHRLWAIVLKEFIQMRRDRVTFGMMIGIPLIQLMLFGFAINSDPRHLPTAVRCADPGPFARTLVAALRQSDYFAVVREAETEAEAARLLETGEVQFVVNIPEDFSRRLIRGEKPTVLVEADATDPAATGPALNAVAALAKGRRVTVAVDSVAGLGALVSAALKARVTGPAMRSSSISIQGWLSGRGCTRRPGRARRSQGDLPRPPAGRAEPHGEGHLRCGRTREPDGGRRQRT